MTVQQARKILGSKSNKFSDETIENFIQTAEIFKTLFFEISFEENRSESFHLKLQNNDKRKSCNLHPGI